MSLNVCIVNGNDQPLKIQSDGVSSYEESKSQLAFVSSVDGAESVSQLGFETVKVLPN